MARLARLVIPGMPHHVTQRGNRRQQTFFNDGDYAAYLELIADWRAFLDTAVPEEDLRQMRGHGRTGRPLGDDTFLGRLESLVGRALKPQKRGPKPKRRAN